jgi:hypothetical protein
MERLQEILDGMEVPQLRRTDLRWLMRNLSINNPDSPLLDEAMAIIKSLAR